MFDRTLTAAGSPATSSCAAADGVRAMAAALARLPVVDVTDAERVERIRALEELKAACAAAQAREAAALDVSVRAAEASAGVPTAQQGRGVGAMVALARRESPHAGGRYLGLARALVGEMPHSLAALSAGALSEWRATLLVRETACLSVEDRARVDREVAGDPARLDGLGDRALAAAARRAAYRLDPLAATARAARATADRCVTLRPAPDAMTWLSALLPVAQGVACYAALSTVADTARTAGGELRGRGQVMADTLVERLTGRAAGSPVPVRLGLVMTDRALLSGDGEPAHLEGYGPLPAPLARALLRDGGPPGDGSSHRGDVGAHPPPGREAADAARPRPGDDDAAPDPARAGDDAAAPDPARAGDDAAQAWLHRLWTDPGSGELVAAEARGRVFPPALRRLLVWRDQTCRTPWCDAPIRHSDHVEDAASGGPTTIDNGQGLCEACNYVKQTPGWTASTQRSAAERPGTSHRPRTGARGGHLVRTTTPTGHTYESRPPPLPGYRPEPPPGAIDQRPPEPKRTGPPRRRPSRQAARRDLVWPLTEDWRFDSVGHVA